MQPSPAEMPFLSKLLSTATQASASSIVNAPLFPQLAPVAVDQDEKEDSIVVSSLAQPGVLYPDVRRPTSLSIYGVLAPVADSEVVRPWNSQMQDKVLLLQGGLLEHGIQRPLVSDALASEAVQALSVRALQENAEFERIGSQFDECFFLLVESFRQSQFDWQQHEIHLADQQSSADRLLQGVWSQIPNTVPPNCNHCSHFSLCSAFFFLFVYLYIES
jgi:hypothetical protein